MITERQRDRLRTKIAEAITENRREQMRRITQAPTMTPPEHPEGLSSDETLAEAILDLFYLGTTYDWWAGATQVVLTEKEGA